jgi:hypothetical protein
MTLSQSIKIFSLALLVGCSNENPSSTKSMSRGSWQSFTFWLEDTSIVQGHIMSDSIEIKRHNNSLVVRHVGKPGIDSLFSWAENLLSYRQPKEIRTCTDYVGKLRIQIHYSDILTKAVSFTSICNWSELNIETHKIDSIIKLAAKY